MGVPRVLVACEFSGKVRHALTMNGIDATSCDLLPSLKSGPHIQDDVRNHLDKEWDGIIAFPPCTYLSSIGNAWMKQPGRLKLRNDALSLVYAIMSADCPNICIENPVGVINSQIRKPDQIIHPWWFGEPFTKRTCLWLKGFPTLEPTHEKPWITYAWVDGGSGNRGLIRDSEIRGLTFDGIASAMGTQWGQHLNNSILTNVKG